MLYVFILGFVLNVAFCALLAVVIFKPESARKMTQWILKLLCKLRLVRNKESAEEKLEKGIAHYSQAAHLLMTRKKLLCEVMLITLFF
jgi:hypothetical protein